jgi:hypothetical protein
MVVCVPMMLDMIICSIHDTPIRKESVNGSLSKCKFDEDGLLCIAGFIQ